MADKKQGADVWNVVEFKTNEKTWSERNFKEKLAFLGILLIKVALMLLLLYLFIISLDLMSNAFRILGGKTAGRTFRNSDLFDNPLAGLVIGILVTVLVQSSSTSTSIIITMTAGNLIEVKNAIPMIMGANIGTSVTNTIVSLGAFNDKDEYRRAFAGATVHDCFNLLTVLILLPVEAATGLLRHIASGICDGFDITDDEEEGTKTDFLKKLTKPVASRLLGIDKKLITKIAQESDNEKLKDYEETSIIKHKQKDDQHLFLNTPMSDGVAGVLMVVVSLLFLCICLMLLVKLLQTIFRGRIAIWFRAALNLEIPAVPFLANYILIVFGMCITILFQSSSVTTSTLTPLVGIGLVRLDKMFAFTVGANIGTTVTGILSALVSDKRKTGLTVAFTHTLFNVVGTLIWYPTPMLRKIPIEAAKINGNLAADLRWFPVVYIITMFALVPLILLGLSLASPWLAAFVGIPFLLVLLAIYVIIGLRTFRPQRLPKSLLGNPSWLPQSLRAKTGSEDEPEIVGNSDAASSPTVAANADLGAGQWEMAPAAWGMTWLVFLALLVVVPNCQWAFVKYTSWDGRNHFGIGGWMTCSYAFEKEMHWATVPNPGQCTIEYLNGCGSEDMNNCANAKFSATNGAYLAYQDSWKSCRQTCSALEWESWCVNLNCGGGQHVKQCNNVTKAVRGMYDIQYAQPNGVAWSAGEICRDIEELCPGMEGDFKVVGDLSVVGLVCVGLGLFALLLYQFLNGKRDFSLALKVSIGALFCGWIFLFAAWLKFAATLGQDATCIVEAESKEGAIWAHGSFSNIFASGAYAHGYVIGAWAVLILILLLLALRINQAADNGSQVQTKEKVSEGDVVAASGLDSDVNQSVPACQEDSQESVEI